MPIANQWKAFALTTLFAPFILASPGGSNSPDTTTGPGRDGTPGTTEQVAQPLDVFNVRAFRVYHNAGAASAGVGFRNLPGGAIELSGLTGGVQAGFLYWTLITAGQPPAGAETISLQRIHPTRSPARQLTGQVIGSGPQPCWAGDRITVYRARVPANILNGNGTYAVTPPTGIAANTSGDHPWADLTPPLYNGASLVAISDTGTQSVALYDAPLAGTTFGHMSPREITYRLNLPTEISSGTGAAFFHQIGADGQYGSGLVSVHGPSAQDVVSVNGTRISGPGSGRNDSDWNGASGGRITQLWDNSINQIGSLLPAGGARMTVHIQVPWDCITPVANMVVR